MKTQWKLRWLALIAAVLLAGTGLLVQPQRAYAAFNPSLVHTKPIGLVLTDDRLITPRGISTSPGGPQK